MQPPLASSTNFLLFRSRKRTAAEENGG